MPQSLYLRLCLGLMVCIHFSLCFLSLSDSAFVSQACMVALYLTLCLQHGRPLSHPLSATWSPSISIFICSADLSHPLSAALLNRKNEVVAEQQNIMNETAADYGIMFTVRTSHANAHAMKMQSTNFHALLSIACDHSQLRV